MATRIAVRTGMVTPMGQQWTEQFQNYYMTTHSHNSTKSRSNSRRSLDGNTYSWMRWRADGNIVSQTKILAIEYCAYIHGMGQSMLESPE